MKSSYRAYFTQSLMNLGLRLLSRYSYRGKHLIPMDEAEEMFTNYNSKFVEINGLRVHYRDEGEGEVLVLIHGFAASLHIWNPWVKRLKGKYRLVRMDLPGFGLSDFDKIDTSMQVDYYTNFLKDFLEKLGIQKCNLVGNSLGGWIAWEFAADHPDFLNKLCLICAAGYFSGLTRSKTRELAQSPEFRKLLKSGVPKFIVKRLLGNAYGVKSKMTRFEVDLYYGLANTEGNLASLIKLANAEIDPRPEKIHKIKAPTLIMWGVQDRIIHYSNAEFFHRDIPDSRLLLYEGVGHIPQVELAARTSEDLSAFLAES